MKRQRKAKIKKWLNTNENEEAVAALEFCAKAIPEISRSVYSWRWVILSTHIALQGYMVAALRQTDGSGPIPDKLFVQICKAEEAGQRPPPERLDKFLDLYGKIKKPERMRKYVMSKHFVPSGTQSRSVKQLNKLRNEFIHFTPKGWMLGLSGLPQICLDCLEAIKFLSAESGNILWHKAGHASRTKAALSMATRALEKLAKAFAIS